MKNWLRPPRRLRPTRAGWVFFAITFGVGLAALNTGNNLLYLVLSLMLAFLVLSGVLSESALRGIEVRRRLPRELFAATPCRIGLEISNRQRRIPAFAIVVEDRTVEAPAGRAVALRVAPGGTERRSYRFTPGQRGPLNFTEFRVFTRFPFGLFSKSLTLPAPGEALVYPHVEPLSAVPLRSRERTPETADDRRDLPERRVGTLAVGLRDYERGDALRRVHWPASLRRRQLLVRQLEHETDRPAEIEVRLRTAPSHDQGFERAVSWAASEAVAFLEAGSRVALRTDAALLPAGSGPRHRTRLLAYLAHIDPSLETAA